MKTSNFFVAVLLVIPLWAWPGVLAQSSCIPSGTEVNINAALTTAGSKAILCASAVFTLGNPVSFTAINQQLYTIGLPTGNTRAILRVNGSSQTAAIFNNYDGTVIKNIQVDGNRPALGRIDPGSANIEMGSASNQVIDNVYSHHPRAWSAMHITQGSACSNATVTNNQVGPSGAPIQPQWADGISLECRNSLVANNVITDATDGGIVIFGSPGSVIKNNIITASTQVLLGGINMVDYSYGGSYLNTRVTNNTINAQGAFIKTGIAMGPQVWGCPPDRSVIAPVSGAIVSGNTLTGAHFGYGFPVSGVSNWTVTGNIDNARHVGVPCCGCGGTVPAPAAFQYEVARVTSSNLQPEYTSAYLYYLLGVTEPSILSIIQSPTACGKLTTNQGLIPGQTLKSCDNRFSLTLQSGGNLVLLFGSTQLWSSGTTGKNSSQAIMQADGNFVIYDSTGVGVWNSGTSGNNGATLSLQNDGNVVIYSSGGTAKWTTGTCCH